MMQFFFNLTLAFRAIATNRLRSVLTIVIIALGITALVGILTSIEVMKAGVSSNFSSMGSNSFQVTSDIIKKKKHKGGGINISVSDGKDITYDEAKAFKERYKFPATVGISFTGSGIATVQYRSEKTNPNVRITGADENYITVTDTKLDYGRNFSAMEIQSGGYACILGSAVVKKLFKRKPGSALNQVVSLGGVKCRVVGIMEAKGGSMMMDADNVVLLPLNTARAVFGGDNGYLLSVIVPDVKMKDMAVEEAEGLFKVIRKLPLGVQNNFTISQNNDLISILLDVTRYIRWAAVVIGIITLLGSVIGLMNIMLVSVAERTREIGVSKALGARSSTIKRQFLTESVMISLMGGAAGVIVGMLLGNIVGLLFGIGFVVPWLWMMVGVSLCAVVGIISGIYPAIKASKLDPIVALRYE
jgi:putative ABC transport system permease protein